MIAISDKEKQEQMLLLLEKQQMAVFDVTASIIKVWCFKEELATLKFIFFLHSS